MSTPRRFIDTLQGVAGLDTDAGLLYTGSRESIYRPVLRKFIEFYGRGWSGLKQAASPQELQHLAHTLVGSASTVGASDIADRARELERACQAGVPFAELHRLARDLNDELFGLTSELERRMG